jgi:predicted metal-dependent peptidase
MPDRMHQKLSDAVVAMMATGNLPYYGEFALFINFFETKNNPYVPTAGVNVTSAGMNFYWDRKFIESLVQSAINFLLIHEEFHILFDHIKRSVGYDQKAANIVQDMIINQIIVDEIMKQQGLGSGPTPFISIPQDQLKNNSALMIPKEYKGEAVFEDLYEWYVNKRREWREKSKEKINQFRKEAGKCPKCGATIPKPGDMPGKGDDEGDDGEGEKEEKEQGKGKGKGKGKVDKGDKDGQGQGGGKDGKDGKDKEKQGKGGQGGDQDSDEDGEGQDGKCPNCGHEHNNNQSRQGKKDTSGKDRYGKYGKNDSECYSLETIFEGEEREEQNTLDAHLPDDIPQELKREIVESIMTKLKNRGLSSGEVEAILNKLRKTRKDYLKEIKRTMSSHIFGSKKSKTIVRPNRRGIEGLKGNKKYKNEINVLLDTSGSMGGEFEKVLSYIFQNDIQMNLIQCDTEVKKVYKITCKKELEKMRIYGLGGTTLQPGLDFMKDKKNKISIYNTVILTDGCTDHLNFKEIKTKTLILSTAGKCPITFDNGRIKQIEHIGKQD